ncbi:hypothetical protein XH89_31270 [Bradyrhizobium sp. CCBAU 53340]|uniref:lysozyme inhibitor LprI family protein n=1 Tax=Bradyrhizobium sp. CCBAU 53340 TaxID=1325112 RepID=UPI00188A27F5|nr:lysozyme inhibitor LprI family protein [Bradyrhizobium sp. CCBAU 53340]QOZ47471.1 hypothetical protein XH89_31270 [Bradyrhizobium sp. CCBAU 53340]
MSVPVRLTLLAAALLCPAAANAMDDTLRASSRGPMAMTLCAQNSDGSKIEGTSEFCKANGYDKLVAAVDASFAAAVTKAPANIRPLLKRDQAWFNEMIQEAAYTVEQADEAELRQNLADALRRRATALDDLARGFGRDGLGGAWANALGGVTVTATESGSYRLDAELNSDYGSDKHWECKLNATLKPGADGWLAGVTVPTQPSEPGAKPADPVSIKLRRQGDTLRVVLQATEEQWFSSNDPDCDHPGQITGTYFASAKQDGTDKVDTSFVTPTFDCVRPETATDEEICADPDLAANDQRLNRAWKALLPRLDDATRRALTDDQRHWVSSQTLQYPEFLHPAWEKQTSAMHYTVSGRDHLNSLQRERIALLEGFDDKRVGLAGTCSPTMPSSGSPWTRTVRSTPRAGNGGRPTGRVAATTRSAVTSRAPYSVQASRARIRTRWSAITPCSSSIDSTTSLPPSARARATATSRNASATSRFLRPRGCFR